MYSWKNGYSSNRLKENVSRSLVLIFSVLLIIYPPIGTSAQNTQKPVQIPVYHVPLKYVIDTYEVAPPDDQQGFIYNNSTYVPLRFIAYSLNMAVHWDPATYTVSVANPTVEEQSEINEYMGKRYITPSTSLPFVDVTDRTAIASDLDGNTLDLPLEYAPGATNMLDESVESHMDIDKEAQDQELLPQTIEVYLEQVTYIFSGKEYRPAEQLPGMIKENSLYVPLRFFSESLGRTIDWDPQTYTVTATSGPEQTAGSEKLLDILRDRWMKSQDGVETRETVDQDGSVKLGEGTGQPSGGMNGGVSGGGSAPGGGGYPIGGGNSPNQPSKSSIENKYIAQAESLQNYCESELTGLSLQYFLSKNKENASAIADQAFSVLFSCESDFANITSSLSEELTKYKYTTEIVDEMNEYFRQQKELGETALCGSVGCASQ